MKRKKIKTTLLLMMLGTVLLTGCSTAKNAEEKASPTSTTAETTQTAKPEKEDATTEPAKEETLDLSGVTLRVNGFPTTQALFEAAGVADTPYKLDIGIYAGGNLALQAMAADELDLVYSSEIPPLFASLAEGGGNFKVVATGESNTLLQDLIVGPQSTAQSVADLKGQKVGYVQSTTAQYFLLKMLDEAGLTWNDIEPVNLSPSDGLAALFSGDIAAFAVYGNQITANLEQGGRVIASGQDILSGNFLYSASELALQNKELSAAIVDYLDRTEKANEWIRGHYEEYAKIAAESSGMSEADYVTYLKNGDGQRKSHIRAYSDKDQASLQDVADTFHKIGVLEKAVDVKTLYSDALSKDIDEKIGKTK